MPPTVALVSKSVSRTVYCSPTNMELFDEVDRVDWRWWTWPAVCSGLLEEQKSAANLHYLRFPAGRSLATGT